MKNVLLLSLVALLSTQARAESLKEIFQSIADSTEPGNGNGHEVITLHGKLNEKQEVAKLTREVNNRKDDCRFKVHADTSGAIKELRDEWRFTTTANRLAGLDNKGLITQIVWSQWNRSTGDGEYCEVSTMKVFGVDGSVLVLNLDETD